MGWLARTAANLAGAISLRPWLLAAAAGGFLLALAAAYATGVYHTNNAWQARRVAEIERARMQERDAGKLAIAAEAEQRKVRESQLEKAHDTIEKLHAELAKKPVRCPVPRAAVRLLDGPGVSAAPRAAPEPARAAPPVASDTGSDAVECAIVIENCAWNRLNVCEPNAQQLEGLQRFYDGLRRTYNAR